MASRIAATATLVAISAFGYFSIVGLTSHNGWGAMFNEYTAREVAVLPDTDIPARTHFTGVAGLDFVLAQLVRVFYPCVTGQLAALPLFSIYFAGQVIALHSILMLEGLRKGNKGTIFFYPAIWGSIYQFVPFGMIIPIYCALYLWLSPLAKQPAGRSKVDLLSMDLVKLYATLPAILLGLVVPTILSALPAPRVISIDQQQIFLALWQIFPAMVAIWHQISTIVVRKLGLAKPSSTPAASLVDAKEIYSQTIYMAQVVHIAVLAFTFVPEAVRAIFKVADISSINWQSVFVPMSLISPRQVSSMAEGTLTVLQYDFYSGCAALFFLVTYLSGAAYGVSSAAATAFKVLLKSVLVGPGAALLWEFWDRDKAALAEVEEEEKKTQ